MDFGLSSWLGFSDDPPSAEAEAAEAEADAAEAEADVEPAFKLETYATATDVPYEAFVAKSIEILLTRDTGEDKVTEWDLLSDEDGVETWSGVVTGTSWNAFKIVQCVNAPKHEVEQALMDVETLLQLDEMTTQIDVLHRAGQDGAITLRHCLSQSVFPFACREFLLVTGATELLDGRVVIASRSLEVEDVAMFDPGYVRAIDIINGIVIDEKKDDDGQMYCVVTLIGQADLGGYVPATIINMLGTSATAKVLAKLKEYLEKEEEVDE